MGIGNYKGIRSLSFRIVRKNEDFPDDGNKNEESSDDENKDHDTPNDGSKDEEASDAGNKDDEPPEFGKSDNTFPDTQLPDGNQNSDADVVFLPKTENGNLLIYDGAKPLESQKNTALNKEKDFPESFNKPGDISESLNNELEVNEKIGTEDDTAGIVKWTILLFAAFSTIITMLNKRFH